MDKPLSKYQEIIIELLTYYANAPAIVIGGEQTEEQLILDTQHGHYQILTIG